MMTGDFHGTWLQELIKNVILSFSGLGVGAALWLAWYDLVEAVHSTGHLRRLWIARAAFLSGFCGILILLGQLIWTTHQPLALDWRTLTFTILVIISALGALGAAWEYRYLKKNERR